MPQFILPLIGILVGAGTGIYSGVEQSQQADQAKQAQQQALQQQQQQQAQAQAQANQRALQASLPNAQEQNPFGTLPGLVSQAGVLSNVPTAGTSGSGMSALLNYLGAPQTGQGSMAGLMNLGQSGPISGGSEG